MKNRIFVSLVPVALAALPWTAQALIPAPRAKSEVTVGNVSRVAQGAPDPSGNIVSSTTLSGGSSSATANSVANFGILGGSGNAAGPLVGEASFGSETRFFDEITVFSSTLPVGTQIQLEAQVWVSGSMTITGDPALGIAQGSVSSTLEGDVTSPSDPEQPYEFFEVSFLDTQRGIRATTVTTSYNMNNSLNTTVFNAAIGDVLTVAGVLFVVGAAGPGPSTIALDFLNTSYFAFSALGNADVQLVGQGSGFNYSPVPVPAALWLFGSALGGLGFIRRV